MTRKHKLKLFQLCLLILGVSIIYFTYYKKEELAGSKIIPKKTQERIQKQIESQPDGFEIFSNIEYSGLDLAGNRYILKSEKAYNESNNKEIVNLISVEAFFYFKDNTVLTINSDKGIYNNKTLDMSFFGNIKSDYEGSKLYAQKAKYSNKEGSLIVSEKVKLNDSRGTVLADKLLFDIKKQTLSISSLENSEINANILMK